MNRSSALKENAPILIRDLQKVTFQTGIAMTLCMDITKDTL